MEGKNPRSYYNHIEYANRSCIQKAKLGKDNNIPNIFTLNPVFHDISASSVP